MSGYLKYFDNGGKNMSLAIKMTAYWLMIFETEFKKMLSTKFHSMPVYDKNYIKAKLKEFNDVVNTNFWGKKVPKEGVHYICIAWININSVIKIEKKNYPQDHLEECKHKIKRKRFLDLQMLNWR